ncbi:glycerophosphodiester phosphodiesterase [Polymorphobacter sp.]|uniref:glycerophosphodiester phosphodiesterase n=1 Tax=Polymorphobacter sp. TaxID=1909290 RepID=UPI003F70D3EE
MRRTILAGLAAAGACLMSLSASAAPLPKSPRAGPPPAAPIVIAHRGASAERPEHTLAAYALAIAEGADFIEPDLVSTRDGVLVARHENEISGTTDVASHPEFAARRRSQDIDGVSVTGWFTEDFTLAELKTLRASERLPQLRPANAGYDGQFDIPTLDEIVALAKTETARSGRTIGIYPETKHPSHFTRIGLPIEPALLKALAAAGWTRASDPVFIQSFEVDNLKALRGQTGVRLVQLIAVGPTPDGHDYDAMRTPAGLNAIKAYADAIGPARELIIPSDKEGVLGAVTSLVADAHAAGLEVHPWTFRPENYFLGKKWRSSPDPKARGAAVDEIRFYLETGIDGLFSDSPAAAVAALAPPDVSGRDSPAGN